MKRGNQLAVLQERMPGIPSLGKQIESDFWVNSSNPRNGNHSLNKEVERPGVIVQIFFLYV